MATSDMMKLEKYIILLFITGWSMAASAQTSDAEISNLKSQTSNYNALFLDPICERQKGNHDAAFDLLRHCVEINPEASEPYYFLSQYYRIQKDRQKALECMERAYQLSPDNDVFTETMAQTYLSQQQYDKAISVYENLLSRDKGRDDVLAVLYELYQHDGQYEKAVQALEQIELIDGKSERITQAKSDLYTRMGNSEAAISEMEALANQYPNDLNYRVMYGDALLQNDQTQRALQVYEDVLTQEPEHIGALLSMANYYTLTGDSAAAALASERVLVHPKTPTDTRLEMLRDEIMQSLDGVPTVDGHAAGGTDSVRVLNHFRQVLQLPQETADVAALCAAYMKLINMPQDSINAMYYKVLEIQPDDSYSRLQLVADAWSREDMPKVISLCTAARQYNPEEMAFYYYQGFAYYREDDVDSALGAFQNGVSVINEESNPVLVSDFYALMGHLLHKKGLEEEALAACDSCLQWNPDNIGCLNDYAYYLSERGEQLDKAEMMSYRAIKAEPKNSAYLDTYAWILFKLERYTEAKIYIDQTLQYDPDASAVLLEHAGDIYYHTGDKARAVDYWKQALDKSSADSEVTGKRKTLLQKKIKLKKYIKQ